MQDKKREKEIKHTNKEHKNLRSLTIYLHLRADAICLYLELSQRTQTLNTPYLSHIELPLIKE
jgi:hypothetical protein